MTIPHPPLHRPKARSLFLTVITAACVGLVIWIPTLETELPTHFVARQWRVAWVGFDIVLVIALGTTAYLAWRGRQLLIFSALISGAMLVSDAWFDIMLSWGTDDLPTSVLSAAFIELPLAALLFIVSVRLLRMTIETAWHRMGLPGPVPRLWQLKIATMIDPVVMKSEKTPDRVDDLIDAIAEDPSEQRSVSAE